METQSPELLSSELCGEEYRNVLDGLDKPKILRCNMPSELLFSKSCDDPSCDDPLIVKNFKKRKVNKSKASLAPTTKKVKINEGQNFVLENAVDVLKESSLQAAAETKARRYQLEVLEKAISGNIIVYLETGCGKTLIAVLLIKSLAHRLRIAGNKRIALFLAPTVLLVHQQSEVISINTDLKVGYYFGDKGVDTWTPDMWATEVDNHEVLVMTPQVLLDALGSSSLRLDLVEVLILDECHHAQRRHPFAQIMSTHYHNLSLNKRPKIFGMTASPVIRKGSSTSTDCNLQIQKLEAILDSKVCTVEDRSDLESFVPTPNQESRYYSRFQGLAESVRRSLEHLKEKFVNSEENCDTPIEAEYFYDEQDGNAQKSISRLHNALDYCLLELGLWPALKAIEIFLKDDRDDESNDFPEGVKKLQTLKVRFLRECLEILHKEIPEGSTNYCSNDNEIRLAVKNRLISPKVHLLVKELRRYREVQDVRCIIFVERVISSLVLANLASWFSDLSFLRCDHMAGVNAEHGLRNSRMQQQIIESFRSGKVNLLVATSVAEEGLDVQSCNSVIRFDLPKTVCSYIQSRGRARRPGSDYIFFLERDNQLHENLMLEFIKSEVSMKQQSCSRAYLPPEERHLNMANLEIFKVESTGALVSMDSSVNLIYRYCSKLPGDKFYRPTPEFSFTEVVEEKLYVCTIKFPPNAPLHVVVGEGRSNHHLSKQAACFEACKQLHRCGALTDNLVPATDFEDDEDKMNMEKKNRSGAGTTKRKELHLSVETEALFGEWGANCVGVTLQAYRISFSFQSGQQEEYTDFALLLNTVLDEDVANMEFQLHLTKGRTSVGKTSVLGNIHLDENQLRDSMKYHEVLFNGMFNKLVFCNKEAIEPTYTCLFTSEGKKENLWTRSRMYLLLPLLKNVDCGGKYADQAIDWKAVCSTAAAANSISQLYAFSKNECPVSPDVHYDAIPLKVEDKDVLQTAAGVIPKSSFKDTVVLTIHTGRIYCVVDVLHDMDATYPFPMTEFSEDPKFTSYSDYFLRTYKKALKFPYQPLLQAKQTHRVHNLLNIKEKSKGMGRESEIIGLVELPPELCIYLGLKSSVIQSIYLLPSIMHRWITVMNASQLRQKVMESIPDCPHVSAYQIMQALSTLRCIESFSFEGLELLGDSFLKYVVSRRLFLVYNEKHEGHLSARRSRAVCNATLHRLALKRELPRFIRDEVFDPSRWIAPGMFCKKDLMCRCRTSNLLGIEVDGNEDEKVITDGSARIGKTCPNGHRWLCSKTIADEVEALIGAFFVEGGHSAAMAFMKWVGIDVDFEPTLMSDACKRPVVPMDMIQTVWSSLEALEKQLSYTFNSKVLLLEAITHASQQQPHGGLCYQRLEFLGDSVLDFLITRHLFNSHPGLTPGCLTDLRSAAVNNSCFARVAVKHNLQKFLRHGSAALLGKITQFVKSLGNTNEDWKDSLFGWEGIEGPKVLGDIVESIAGAITVDSGFDLEVVWTTMKPLLSPIVNPETLSLHPVRELLELCNLKGFSLEWRKFQGGKAPRIELSLDLGENKLVETTPLIQRKLARKDLSKKMLASLKGLGLTHPQKTTSIKRGIEQGLQSVIPLVNMEPDEFLVEHNESVIGAVSLKELSIKTGFKQICMLEYDEIGKSDQIVDRSRMLKLNDASCSANLDLKVSLPRDIESSLDCIMPIGIVEKDIFPGTDDQKAKLINHVEDGTLATSFTMAAEEFEGDSVMLTSTSGSNGSICPKARGNSSINKQEANGSCGPGDFGCLPAFLMELEKLVTEDAPSECYFSFTEKGLHDNGNNCRGSACQSPSEDNETQYSSIGFQGSSACSKGALIPPIAESLRFESSFGNQEALIAGNNPVENDLTGVANMCLQKLRSHATLSTRIKAGNGRSSLYELCSKRKWKDPQFFLSREEGLPHAKRFTFSVKVSVQEIGTQEVEGSTMPDKRKAMDSAAVNMILHLTSMGI